MSNLDNVVYNNFCGEKQCEQYIEWDFDIEYGQVYRCISCQLVGQSYDIDRIAFACPFLDEIVKFKREVVVRNRAERKENHKRAMWRRLQEGTHKAPPFFEF